MKISEIYTKYRIPSILQDHMYRVAAIGRIVVDLIRPNVDLDAEIVTKELLLHDMGNIIKIPIENNRLFNVSEQASLKRTQAEFIERYGDNEHLATQAIAKELKAPKEVTYILDNTGSSKLHLTLQTKDWYLKVCSYADFRVAPDGIVSITERFDEIKKRYTGQKHELANDQKTEEKKQLALLLEKQIQGQSSSSLQDINDQSVVEIIKELKAYEL